MPKLNSGKIPDLCKYLMKVTVKEKGVKNPF